ncbi:MAG: SMP-30/gluconolactonase/LRE family protein [Solirubrobacteraceae bacterium]
MKSPVLLAVALGALGATAALAQTHKLTEGPGLKANEDAREPAVLATCTTPPPAAPNFGGNRRRGRRPPPPPKPPTHVSAIPDIIAAGKHWKVIWHEEGNNADGIVGLDDGSVLVAQQDNSDVVKVEPNGHASVVYQDTDTGGALSMNKQGQLFDAERGLHEGIWELAPQHKILAINYQGEPLDCLGGLNDLTAAANGGVYFTQGKLYYASPDGVVTREGHIRTFTNGIILSPDEQTLYVTDGNTLQAFDVQPDGMLTNQRTLATLKGFGDGSTVDGQGRIYVSDSATGIDVFNPDGTLIGSIPPPKGMDIISLAFGGHDKKTLFAAALFGDKRGTGHRGLPSDKGRLAQAGELVSIPMIAQGYMGRAK